MNELYDRQKNLGLLIPSSVCIIGCGGIGSWLALNFALVGVKELVLFDPDKIEKSNLNRTPFKLSHVGKYKTTCVKNLIEERRLDTKIIAVSKKYMGEKLTSQYVFDCTDGINVRNAIKLGYDGLGFTIISDTNKNEIWGEIEAVRYSITPSFLGTPQFIANIVVNCVVCNIPIKDITNNICNIMEKILEGK